MISAHARGHDELANEVATVMLQARVLILRRIATSEQCTHLVVEILGCADIEELRSYVRDQIECLVAN